MKKQQIYLLLISFLLIYNAYGQTTYYSRQSGAWNNPDTWSTTNHSGAATSQVPGTTVTDIVIIAAGHIVDYNAFKGSGNSATVASLTIGTTDGAGYLVFPFSNENPAGTADDLNANFELTITGDVSVAANGNLITLRGGDAYPTSGTMPGAANDRNGHDIFIGGNLSNAGTIDLQNDLNTDYEVGLTFNGTANQIISGEGTWDTYDLTYHNTGTSPANRMENQSVAFTTSVEAGRSTFTQGTYVHSNSGTYNNQSTANDGTDYTDVSFIIEDGVFNMAGTTTGDPLVTLTNGSITVNGGRFNGGNNGVGSGEAININVSGDVTVAGSGIFNIGDGDPGTSTTPTDGTLTIGGSNSSVNASTLYTHDLTLNAGAALTIENGATVSVGNSSSNVGDINLNGSVGNGSTLTINDGSTQLSIYDQLLINEDCSFTQNNGTVDITPNFTTGGDPESVQLQGPNASYTMMDGNLNVMTSITEPSTNIDAIILEANNTSLDVQGGTVVLGNIASGRGRLRFRQAAGETVTFSASGTASITVADAIQRNTAGSVTNITLSDNAQLLVGTDNGSTNVTNSFHEGSLVINDNAIARFGLGGDLDDVTINGSGTLETGTTNTNNRFDINGAFIYGSATANCTFFQGVDIEAGGSLNISAGTIDILPNVTIVDDIRLQIRGDLTMNGGTINLGESITDITGGNLLQVYDGGSMTINAGTFSMLASPALTSIANRNPFNITNNDAGEDATQGDGTVTVGDGSGGANSAQLIIAPNLAAELPTPSTRNIFDMDGANSVLTINADGYLQVGGGNIGNLRLNTLGAIFYMNGGTCDITASLTLDNGTELQMSGGTLNVGTGDSNGANRIYFATNPSDTTLLALSGGTINVGDGNSDFQIGNSNNNPAFGTTTAYQSLEISGGTFNLNGSFQLDDANARFIMSAGNFNINPQGDQNTPGDESLCYFREGIVEFSGGQITLINPHATTGVGYALRVNDQGNPGTGNLISGMPSGTTPTPANLNGTFRFGNGSTSRSGSADAFDLNLSPDHVYGSFLVNNPSGTNRQVELISAGNDYQMNGNLILFAGTFDINDNTLNRDAVGGALTINPTGRLIIGNSNGVHHFPGNTTAFSSYTLNAGSTVEYDGAGDAIISLPGSASFSNLLISGSGNKTLSSAETVRDTLTLEGSTFIASTNLTPSTDAVILRTATDVDGIMTGTIQGSNPYTLAYRGVSKTTQGPEWSGAGTKSLTVEMDPGETLSLHSDLTAGGSLSINSGILNDAGFTLTVNGNISNSATHSGSGSILMTGSAAIRNIGGDGSGVFQNVELNDALGAIFNAGQTINGTLTLTSGVLNIDNFALNLGLSATVSGAFNSANMIQVNAGAGSAGVSKVYSGPATFSWPVGCNGKYTPATIEVINAVAGGTITVNPVDAENPYTTDAGDFSLDYYWIVSRSGFGSETANLSFTYDQTDADGRGNEAGYVPARYAPTTWTNLNNVALVDETTNVISFNNVPYINGEFTAAEPSEFGTVLTYYSRADGNWNTASSWSNTALGGTAATTIPGSSTPVIIGNGNTITVSTNDTNAPSVEIQSTGTLEIADATTGHDFGAVSGTGTFRIITNDTDATGFPGGTYSDLLSASGGTVEYSGSGDYTILDSPVAFNRLVVSGSGIITLPDVDFTTVDDLSVEGSATVLISNTANGNLSIGDSLNIVAGSVLRLRAGTARTLTVGTDIINAGTFHADGGGVSAHTLSLGGSLVNSGAFDMANTANHYCNVTFTGTANASISGSGGTTDFHRLIVNKGTSATPELELSASNFMLGGPTNTVSKALELQNGTLVLSAGHTLTLSTGGGAFTIPATAGLWINHAGALAEITTASSDLSLAGLLRLTDGTVNIGDDLSGLQENSIFYTSGDAALTVEGGTLTVGGAIRPNPDAATLNYTQSGGDVRVANNNGTSEFWNGTGQTNRSIADFSIETGTGSSFNMSGGILEIVRRNTTDDGKGFWINEGTSYSVSGGTVRIVTAATTGSHDIGVSSAVPFWNLEIGQTGSSFSGRVGASPTEYDLQILNDFTLNLNNSFKLHRANNNSPSGNDEYDLYVGGNFTVDNGTIGYPRPEDPEGTVVFNGSGLSGQPLMQQITDNSGTGSITFFNVTINNTNPSGSVQLASSTNLLVEKNWTYTTGTLDQNGQTITFNGTINQVIGGNPLAFDDIVIDNAAGVTLSASQMTINSDLSLTNGILNLGVNQLNIAAVAGISTPTSFDNTRMIITNGQEAALGIEKSFDGNATFLFPLGTGTDYTPASLQLTNHATSGNGTLRVIPVAERNALAPAATSLNYYWVLESAGFGAAPDVSHTYTYVDTDVAGTEADYLDAYYDDVNWQQGVVGNVDEAANTISLSTSISLNQYSFTAGYSFVAPVIYYSTGNGTWDMSSTWNTAADGSGTSGLPTTTNPVIIQNGDTVTIGTTGTIEAASTTLESTGMLDIEQADATQYSIGTVRGTGTLRFSVGATPTLPVLSNNFVAAGGGTVDYVYSANNDLPTSQTIYNNLVISGTSRNNLRVDLTVNGNLSITTSNRMEDNGFIITGTPAGTLSLANGSELRVEGANSFPSGFGTYDMQSGSLVRYNSGNDQTVASLNGDDYWDLQFSGDGIRTLEGNIIIADDLTMNSRSVLSASSFNINIQGDWNRDSRNSSAFLPGTGTVIFDGSATQEIDIMQESSTETFGNVEINNSAGITMDVGDAQQTTQLNITGDLIFTAGTIDLDSRPLTISGNLINNTGSTTPIVNASDVSFNNTLADQSVGGTNSLILENISMDKAAGTTLTLDTLLTINGTFDWPNDGTITLVNDPLTFGTAASITGSFSSSRMIVTDGTSTGPQVIKEGTTSFDAYDFTFPIGVSGSYTPILVNASAVSGSGSIAVRSVSGNTSTSIGLLDASRAIDRYFMLDMSGITSLTAAIDFTYSDADVQGSEINYLSWVYEGAPISAEAGNSFVTPATNTFGSTDITITAAATEWIAAEAGALFPRLFSVSGGDWHTAATWNTVSGGGGTAAVPNQYNDVEIQSTHAITSASNASAASLQLDGTLELTNSAAGYDIGTFTGTGTLVLNSGDLPTYNVLGTTFFDNGTVEFSDGGPGAPYTLPSEVVSYNNLVISGSNDKTLGSNITVSNVLTIDNVTLDADNTNNFNISLGGSLSLVGSGSLNPRDGTFALIGSTAQSVPTGITFNNLQFDNVGTKSITTAGTFSANNFRILAASGVVNFSTGTDIDITGNWSNASGSGASAYSNVQDLTLSGNANQNISGVNGFHNLNISKSGGGGTRTVTISGTVILNDGASGGGMTVSNHDVVNGTANYNLLGDWTNDGTFSTSGTVNFNGTAAQSISGDNSFGSLIIDNAAGVSITDQLTTTIANDLTVTSGTFSTGTGTATVVFDGMGEQQINGSVTFNNLTKQAGDTLRLSGNSTVNGTLTLTEGIINTTSSDLLIIGPDGDIPSGSVNSYVNGPLQHTENSTTADTKLFPFGNDGVYRPITLNLTQADATVRTYTGSITEGAPPSRTLPTGADSLTRVSAFRYYTITQSPSAAVTAASVTIDYNVDDRSDDGPTLRIAKSDGAGNWINIGGTGSASGTEPGDFVAGTITSGNFTTFSDFVLASSSEPLNPLPIELLSFSGEVAGETVELKWVTAWEKNNDIFVVERSEDGVNFTAIGEVHGAGDRQAEFSYNFTDAQPLQGIAYYRLKQVDIDGNFDYSRIISLTYLREVTFVAGVYPNPAENGQTVLRIEGAAPNSTLQLKMIHASGRVVKTIQLQSDEAGSVTEKIASLNRLASGVYTLLITGGHVNEAIRLVLP